MFRIVVAATILSAAAFLLTAGSALATFKGIAPADLPRIFDSFFSTKSNGLGLGLNISRSIVESHGGSLTARNNGADAGATFEFVLPSGGSPSP